MRVHSRSYAIQTHARKRGRPSKAHNWRSREERVNFFESCKQSLNITKLSDWYNISYKDVARVGGEALLRQYYSSSLPNALADIYPHHEWHRWRFVKIPKHTWSAEYLREFFEWFAMTKWNEITLNRWYSVSTKDVTQYIGRHFQSQYGSLQNSLRIAYPDHEWLWWKFDRIDRAWWGVSDNRIRTLRWLETVLTLQQEDWYSISRRDLEPHLGKGYLNEIARNLPSLLHELYPDVSWHPWRFKLVVPARIWHDVSIRRQYFDWLKQQLRLNSMEDWYNVTSKMVATHGGGFMLSTYYGGSLFFALSSLYPQHNWEFWRFDKIPQHVWQSDLSLLRQLVENKLAPKLNVEHIDDWLNVSTSSFIKAGGRAIIEHYGGIQNVLRLIYPEYPWDQMAHLKTPSRVKIAQTALRLGLPVSSTLHLSGATAQG